MNFSLKIYSFLEGNKYPPTVEHNSHVLDFYAPIDMFLQPHANIDVNSGYGVEIPEGYVGVIYPKTKTLPLVSGSSQLIHPSHNGKEFRINLIYNGLTTSYVHKGDPIFQLIIMPVARITDVQLTPGNA